MKISVITALVGLAAAAADPRCSTGDPQCLMTEEGGDIGSLLQPKGDDVVSMMQVRASVVGNGPVDLQTKKSTCRYTRRRYDKKSKGENWADFNWWECERVLRPDHCGPCAKGFRPITTGQFKNSESGGTLTSFQKMCGRFSITPYNLSTPLGNFCLNGTSFSDANSTCAAKIQNPAPAVDKQQACMGACSETVCNLTGCVYDADAEKCEATQCCCVKVEARTRKTKLGFVAVGSNFKNWIEGTNSTCVYGKIER